MELGVLTNKSQQKTEQWRLGDVQKKICWGWYGLKKGLRGRFGMYIPPLMEALGLEKKDDEKGRR